ncbi:MAG: hypothetical protein R2991_10155 [Thermoanaerobaculia bacterium]
MLIIQAAWAIDWVGRLVSGRHPIGGTEYMFDPAEPVAVKAALDLPISSCRPLLL